MLPMQTKRMRMGSGAGCEREMSGAAEGSGMRNRLVEVRGILPLERCRDSQNPWIAHREADSPPLFHSVLKPSGGRSVHGSRTTSTVLPLRGYIFSTAPPLRLATSPLPDASRLSDFYPRPSSHSDQHARRPPNPAPHATRTGLQRTA